ncbi:M3 family oligoendopeptidase [Oecophyllibacter saccharovorans]|uniref:M3 family oligoendopeptidase n=1 Tax=Oecophyllibacter saccharovorans TaxID=2558360 RepID=UPI001143EAD2|nr:M3 family oligoendopeptidase [Oecophyllibacter saccharovorans]QDH15685.1 M3 family oligoendopeptidase [Oecophyllibacter saccharovorans]
MIRFPLSVPASPSSTGATAAAPQAAQAAEQLGAPRWDLGDLYLSPDDPALKADLERLEREAEEFEKRWKDRLEATANPSSPSSQDQAPLTPVELAQALEEYQDIEEGLGKVGSYAQLLFAAQTTDPATGRFAQHVREQVTALSVRLLFFTLALNRLDESWLQDEALAAWRPWLRDLRIFRPFQLSDDVERALMETSVTGRAAWVRLFDETMAAMTAELDGRTVPLNDAFNQLTDADRGKRAQAAQAISAALQANQHLLVSITNTLAKDKAVADGMRGYPRPVSSRNRANMVEDGVVDALVTAVDQAYPRLSHRYYALKAKWLGLERLQHWDRNAPLPGHTERLVPWQEGREIVRQAYQAFDPEMGALASRFLDRPWIDAAAVAGKSSGAFAHPTVPSVHPYLLMNYQGRARDVMTLAHEMGHGIHQILAGQAQGYLKSSTPLTLAETASVFGEMLTFQSLLDAEKDPGKKRFLLAAKIEDMLNTVVRQTAFYQFETQVHEERRNGELSAERLGQIWRGVQERSLGPAFEFTPDYDAYWSYIPHFIHAPFYVYAYAFGDCLVNALYSVYREQSEGFAAKYRTMLQAGGTLRHRELLAPFGLDAGDPAFWNRGLDVIDGLITTLEEEVAHGF